MSLETIDPDYNWKQAATQEGVDYAAVQKSFMDQSYAVVANKAKILFKDPFRLGFEIVHRNEKATKMVGIYAFRVNSELLYVPVFFVNGELKPADMIYRVNVKRFVPLTEEWCAYLVRGVHEQSGNLVEKNRFRQADAYMSRLASPQRVKYASDEHKEVSETFAKAAADGTIWNDLLAHSGDNTPLRKLLPLVIEEQGPEALTKLAEYVEESPEATKFLVTNYTRDELENVSGWLQKAASEKSEPAITIITAPALAKSASERERIFDRGYALVDSRPEDSLNTVVEEIGDGSIKSLKSSGKILVLKADGSNEEAWLTKGHLDLCADGVVGHLIHPDQPSSVYLPSSRQIIDLYDREVFGEEMLPESKPSGSISADKLEVGKCYVGMHTDLMSLSSPFMVCDAYKDGECHVVNIKRHYGLDVTLYYATGRGVSEGRYVGDDVVFLEVDCDVEYDGNDVRRITPKRTTTLMDSKSMDTWIRTAGGVTTSNDVTVESDNGLTFDIHHSQEGTILKSARDLGWLEAHIKLAEDFSIHTDIAGNILEKAVDNDVTYRVYTTQTKHAYLTRAEGMENWIETYDPELAVRTDAPQMQVLTTQTPRRPDQQSRYGDTYQGMRGNNDSVAPDVITMDDIMTRSPEDLARMSSAYELPHIFDHGCVKQMATSSSAIVEQITRYIPDLEAGVDRCFRILFLLRYRPADFEELYGKDDLVSFEQELSELATRSGENLLRMLQRFNPEQYAAQEN